MTARAFVSGCAGAELTAAERAFFRDADPWGLILFQRNCVTPQQIQSLTSSFRDCVGRGDAPVLIDQEGGRVQRLKPPQWRTYPSGAQYGAVFARDEASGLRAVRNCARLIADDLHSLGITVDCLPVLDVPQPGSHNVIGDRAYGADPRTVIELARAAGEGLLDGGVLPVIKHIPGHGRAMSDSHKALPVVEADRAALEGTDFEPFRALNDFPVSMTAHVVYTSLDPEHPATQSSTVINGLIRADFGFDGLILTDDLSMQALSGTYAERAAACFRAGCDVVLHCNGRMDQMEAVAGEVPEISGKCAERTGNALARLGRPREYDVDEALRDLDLVNGESV